MIDRIRESLLGIDKNVGRLDQRANGMRQLLQASRAGARGAGLRRANTPERQCTS